MDSVRARLEAVTPLFLAGADPRGKVELRVPSIRGVLRFWLRALLGGVLGDSNLDTLRQAEASVFGSTDTGASPVVLRLVEEETGNVSFSNIVRREGKHYSPGIAYLFFAARSTRDEPERQAFAPGTRFRLELGTRPGSGDSAGQALKLAYASLWLLTHLGGLGTRSRRGAGGLQAIHEDARPGDLPSLVISSKEPTQLRTEFAEALKRLRSLVSTSRTANPSSPSHFDVLHPAVCTIGLVNKLFDSWHTALEAAGKTMQQFRSRHNPVHRAAFGLPIVFRSRARLAGEIHRRRASPLLLRLIRLSGEKYVLVFTVFRAHLLAKGENLKLQGRPAIVPDLTIIEDFLKDLEEKAGPLLEVTGW
ncbi:type III-B CRISPR module RAMP protein Cmr1 [Candidatus Bathyarchaeota archaeon]|nr:MAG: type III-B CRISPR module RAMP protein Cmr1 [Candidatus Bathyarchaeota archaeon]